ncbi:beta-lactamase family protein [Clostridium tagluense]|uniref:serine hydrolase n=1 Tax=Clostridium tagluense TaxID=360422 RepID=UPI001C0C8029|nr:serine hydrolase domain-containing protein [Clostridium tagluense]MBU3129236.1 beta-lactamase family protein [Clostridium tagluense]MCB2310275.1 beta-lactamase family protein [Clostridium tagluense]MCB2315083.1 beta-lactamase family protein [Clostridium tagluense]MCB2319975.1 beta-lactamase family protein [Clostridium tagluense]MCB2324826.1 beta-lactamase family protein [Clostridium tagluense]
MKKITLFSIISILSMSLFMGCGAKNNDTVPAANVNTEKVQGVSSKTDALFTDLFGSGKFSGYVYVTKNNSIILDKGYGNADFEKGTGNTAQTKFDLASLTKQFTALSVMQLEEKKMLNVNDKIDIRKFRCLFC